MAIRYFNDSCSYRLPEKRRTREWLIEVAREEGYKVGEINYIFCSAERHLQINRDFLGHDYYTDIITFDESDLRGEGVINGEIYIDVETVADNAAQFGATRLEEMRRVVVHGVLHLCGQKDKTPRAEREMHRKEDKYLAFWKR
jgi:rRNA maturation RNase YbeY